MLTDQDRKVRDIFTSRDRRVAELNQRLKNLESAEFSLLNYYAGMSQFNLSTVIAVGAISTFYTITGMVAGNMNGFTFAASQLTCAKAGIYGIQSTVSFSNMVGNVTRTAVLLNSALIQNTVNRSYVSAALNAVPHPGCGDVELAVGDIIELAIANDTDLDDPTINYASLYLHRIGD